MFKKRSLGIVMVFILLVSIIMAGCDEEIQESFIPTNISNGSAGLEFIYEKDKDGYALCGLGDCTDAVIVIPNEVDGKPVVAIKKGALQACLSINLCSIVIPDSVTVIEKDAFSGNPFLTEITIGTKDSKLNTLGSNIIAATMVDKVNYAGTIAEWRSIISKLTGTLWNYRDYSIYEIIVSCDDGKLIYHSNEENGELEKLIGPEGLEYTLNDDGKSYRVVGIGECNDPDIVLPDDYKGLPITQIEGRAFMDCAFLESITIPDRVIFIGGGAFENCQSLKKVTLGKYLSIIGETPFKYCKLLESITVHSENANYKSIDGNLYTKDGKTLIQYATANTSTSFTVPATVETIADYCFYDCTPLVSVILPDGLKHIGVCAFANCTYLENIAIPVGAESIGAEAFGLCIYLQEISVPDSVTILDGGAFSGCQSLRKVYLGSGISNIRDYTFAGCRSLTEITIANTGELTLGSYVFGNEWRDYISLNYYGTIEEQQSNWINESHKWQYWYSSINDYTICCTNGEITKDGTITYK